MKERPILFSAPMVRALLDGSKTQTRRIVKPADLARSGVDGVELWTGFMGWQSAEAVLADQSLSTNKQTCCPYGAPGDRLWVRETFFAYGRWETRYSEKKRRDEWHFIDMTLECDRAYQYAADNPDVPLAKGRGVMPGWWKRPAIHMPRAVSRIFRDVVSVRVERLNECSEADAIAEGIPEDGPDCPRCHSSGWLMQGGDPVECEERSHSLSATDEYRELWESINGAGSWATNPWVWVISFRRATP